MMKCTSSGVIAPKLYIPPSKLTYKRHVLGMSTGPGNYFYRLKLCRLSCMLTTSTPPKIQLLMQFFGVSAKPICKIRKFFIGACSGTPIHACYFKHGRNRCRISVRKATLYWWQEKQKNVSNVPFGGTPVCTTTVRTHVKIWGGNARGVPPNGTFETFFSCNQYNN